MDIQDFYKDVLHALHYEVVEDDLISYRVPGGTAVPATVDEKRLVLPTQRRLKDGIGPEYQAFHPLSENLARRGASPVLEHMQRMAKAYLAFYIKVVADRLLEVAIDPALQKDLPPKCMAYLTKVQDADKKTFDVFEKLTSVATKKNKFITVYLKNGGTLDDTKYNRLCVIQCPLLDLLKKADTQVLGVTLRKKDIRAITALLEHVLPRGDDIATYSDGSNAKIAPFFDAFLKAYKNVAETINATLKLYGKAIDFQVKPIPLSYVPGLDHFDQFHGQIATLPGNEGKLGPGEVDVEDPPATAVFDQINRAAPPKPATPDTRPPWETPARPESTPPPQSRPTSTPSGRTSMDDFRRAMSPAPQSLSPYGTPSGYPTQPTYGGYAPPMPGYMAPPQPQPRQPFADALALNASPSPMPQAYGAVTGQLHWGGASRRPLL